LKIRKDLAKTLKKGAITMPDAKGQDRLDRLEKLAEEMFSGIAQLRESQAKTDEQIRELKVSQAKTDEQIRELKVSQAKTDEQLKRTDEQLRKTIQKLDNIGSQLGDLGLVQGEVAEDLFWL
jgi:chromosome segregation ATPase